MRFARDCTGIACSRVMNIKAVWPITVLVSKRKKKKKIKKKKEKKTRISPIRNRSILGRDFNITKLLVTRITVLRRYNSSDNSVVPPK